MLASARQGPLPVWIVRLQEVADWWQERLTFGWRFTSLGSRCWRVQAICTPQATLLGRLVQIEDQSLQPFYGLDQLIRAHDFILRARCMPCLALSPRTPAEVACFLHEQGYPVHTDVEENAHEDYACYLDLPDGLGQKREEQVELRSKLLQKIEQLEKPLLRFGYWPSGYGAALSISGDIDSVTIQDFFLRIVEVRAMSQT